MASIGEPRRRIVVSPKVVPVPQPLEPMPSPQAPTEPEKVPAGR